MPAPANPIQIQHNGLSVIQQLQLLQLPANKKRKLLRKAGKAVQKNSRARIRQQKDLSGQTMEARKNKRKRKKMLPVFELRGGIPVGYAMGMGNPVLIYVSSWFWMRVLDHQVELSPGERRRLFELPDQLREDWRGVRNLNAQSKVGAS